MKWREGLSPEEEAKHEAETRRESDALPPMTAEKAAEAERMTLDTNRDGW